MNTAESGAVIGSSASAHTMKNAHGGPNVRPVWSFRPGLELWVRVGIHSQLTSNWNELNPDSSQIYTRLNASAQRLHYFGQLPLKDASSQVGLRQPRSSGRPVAVSIVSLRLLLAWSRGRQVRRRGGEPKLHNYLKPPSLDQVLCVSFCVSHCFPYFQATSLVNSFRLLPSNRRCS
jgi:hypothetical protein